MIRRYRAPVPDLRITADQRAERLTDDETVRLGRLLTHSLGVIHVYYPEDTATVALGIRDYCETLTSRLADLVQAIIGPFSERVMLD